MFWKKKITPEEAQQEIDELISIYRERFGGNGGFLVGTCLGKTKHKYGDSGRYWKLKNIINNYKRKKGILCKLGFHDKEIAYGHGKNYEGWKTTSSYYQCKNCKEIN